MEVNWLTVAAQIVNFLVLVWLLKRFLYGPIVRAMKQRAERIEERLREAREEREAAGRESEKLRRMQADLDASREEVLEAARGEARELRDRLETELRDEIDEMRRTWREDVRKERDDFLQDLRRRTAAYVNDLARAALSDLAGANLGAQLVNRFVDELDHADREKIDRIADAAREGGEVRVESAGELSPAAREALTEALRERVAPGASPTFDRSDDLLLGLRLHAGGQVLEWSLSGYLRRLESAVDEKLAEAEPAADRAAA